MKRWLLCLSLPLYFSFVELASTPTPLELSAEKRARLGYFDELKSIQKTHEEFHAAFLKPKANKDSIFRSASSFIHYQVSRNLYDYWYGTPWEFYGTTDTPQVGSIACGFFVTTLLRDVGVKLDRRGLAETYSEKMIKTLVQQNCIKKYTPFDLAAFVDELSKKGDALYIVGLDLHTGFISVEKGEVWFIHSTVLDPRCVIKEKAIESAALIYNRYTVCGCLTEDRAFLSRWLTQL